MTTLGTTVPFYGGGQVPNPANVIYTSSIPSANLKVVLGTLAVVSSTGTMYGAVSNSGGMTTWAILGGGSGAVATLTDTTGTSVTPIGGNIQLSGTANQITVLAGSHKLTWSFPSAVTFPGSATATTSLAAGTTITAGTGIASTTGDIVATAGKLVAGGDSSGSASTNSLSNVNSTTIGAGVGSVAMSTGNAATNSAWIKVYVGTVAHWIPAWTTNAP